MLLPDHDAVDIPAMNFFLGCSISLASEGGSHIVGWGNLVLFLCLCCSTNNNIILRNIFFSDYVQVSKSL